LEGTLEANLEGTALGTFEDIFELTPEVVAEGFRDGPGCDLIKDCISDGGCIDISTWLGVLECIIDGAFEFGWEPGTIVWPRDGVAAGDSRG